MNREPGSFSLKALFLSVACFAFAMFLLMLTAKFFIRKDLGPETSDFIKLAVLASGPFIGIATGAGLGLLMGGIRKAMTDGAIVGFLLAVIMLIRWAIPG
jgi:hypothetical protein